MWYPQTMQNLKQCLMHVHSYVHILYIIIGSLIIQPLYAYVRTYVCT